MGRARFPGDAVRSGRPRPAPGPPRPIPGRRDGAEAHAHRPGAFPREN